MSIAKIPLELINVASPCTASWDGMSGDEHARFCGQCAQFVYNISELTQADAEALIMEHEGKMCVRYYRRIDGTIMTKDCPVGWRGVKRRIAIAGSIAAAAIVAILSFVTLAATGGGGDQGAPRMQRLPNPFAVIHDMLFPPAIAGEICPPPNPPAPPAPPNPNKN